jgi:hypothetical protein
MGLNDRIKPMKKLALLTTAAFIASLAACGSDSKTKEVYYVPDMTGVNLQTAQDCLQELGFYMLDDQPAPGQPRLQISDRNWRVVDQNVQGRVEDQGVKIILESTKEGDTGSEYCPQVPAFDPES